MMNNIWKRPLNNHRLVKILFLILILILGIKLFFHFKYYAYFAYYNQKVIAFIESFHPYDDIVFIVFQVFQVLIAGAIPAEISGITGGYLYGPIVGVFYSTIGLSIGSWLAFLLSRRFGFNTEAGFDITNIQFGVIFKLQ